MVIQPFSFIKSTAFKERMEMVTKINEIIDNINNATDVTNGFDERITNVENVSNGNASNIARNSNSIVSLSESIDSITDDFIDFQNDIGIEIAELRRTKQNTLTAGTGITITNDVISANATGGGLEKIAHTYNSANQSITFGLATTDTVLVVSNLFSVIFYGSYVYVPNRIIDIISVANPDDPDGGNIDVPLRCYLSVSNGIATVQIRYRIGSTYYTPGTLLGDINVFKLN